MVNYSEFPLELTMKVAEHVEFYEDFSTFGKVCTRWRNAAKLADRSAALHQTPWLMLGVSPSSCSSTVKIYSVYNSKFRLMDLPKISYKEDEYWSCIDDDLDDSPNEDYEYDYSCCYSGLSDSDSDSDDDARDHYGPKDCVSQYLCSSRGWLVHRSDFNFSYKGVALVHPLSKKIIITPCLPRNIFRDLFKSQSYLVQYGKFALSDSPSTTSDFTLAMIFKCWRVRTVGFWRSKDEEWVIKEFTELDDTMDITFYKGEFYVVDSCARIVAANASDNTIRSVNLGHTFVPNNMQASNAFLVESDGALLLVLHKLKYVGPNDQHPGYLSRTPYFRVWEVNIEEGQTKEVENLGNRALFLGRSSSFSVQASPDGCKPNCIYYVNYSGKRAGKQDRGIYDLTTRQMIKQFDRYPMQNSFWVEAPSRFHCLDSKGKSKV